MSFTPGRLEAALRHAAALPDERARRVARDLVVRVLGLHREGLDHIMRHLRDAGAAGDELVERVRGDELVRSLLELHGLDEPSPRPHGIRHLQCELCAAALEPRHPHLLETAGGRRIVCACTSCSMVFGPLGRQYRPIPPVLTPLPHISWNDEVWQRLGVPVGLSFFVRSAGSGAVTASYPGAAGTVESPVDGRIWAEVSGIYPELDRVAPDVEAVLVNRLRPGQETYRISIDRCYELAGMVRGAWHGLTGGDEAAAAITQFFDQLRRESPP